MGLFCRSANFPTGPAASGPHGVDYRRRPDLGERGIEFARISSFVLHIASVGP
jgi:hypothetical protein